MDNRVAVHALVELDVAAGCWDLVFQTGGTDRCPMPESAVDEMVDVFGPGKMYALWSERVSVPVTVSQQPDGHHRVEFKIGSIPFSFDTFSRP